MTSRRRWPVCHSVGADEYLELQSELSKDGDRLNRQMAELSNQLHKVPPGQSCAELTRLILNLKDYIESIWNKKRYLERNRAVMPDTPDELETDENSPGTPAAATYALAYEKRRLVDLHSKNEPQRLLLTHAMLLLCRARKSRMIDWTLLWEWLTHPFRNLEIPDFAYNKHNARGRKLGRSWAHFFNEGTLLHPHVAVDGEAEMRLKAMKAISDPSGNRLFD